MSRVDTIVSDFNGTIAKRDLAKLVLHRFALPGWEKYDALFAEGKISFRVCFEKEYAMLHATSKKEVLEFIQGRCELREGFKEFSQSCSRAEIKLIIASKGLDFVLNHAFKVNKLRSPALYSPTAKLQGGSRRWQVSFPNLPYAGFHNFKESLVYSLKKEGHHIGFVGDDAYDFWAAKRSDKIFAIRGSGLEKECLQNGLFVVGFENFSELIPLI